MLAKEQNEFNSTSCFFSLHPNFHTDLSETWSLNDPWEVQSR